MMVADSSRMVACGCGELACIATHHEMRRPSGDRCRPWSQLWGAPALAGPRVSWLAQMSRIVNCGGLRAAKAATLATTGLSQDVCLLHFLLLLRLLLPCMWLCVYVCMCVCVCRMWSFPITQSHCCCVLYAEGCTPLVSDNGAQEDIASPSQEAPLLSTCLSCSHSVVCSCLVWGCLSPACRN